PEESQEAPHEGQADHDGEDAMREREEAKESGPAAEEVAPGAHRRDRREEQRHPRRGGRADGHAPVERPLPRTTCSARGAPPRPGPRRGGGRPPPAVPGCAADPSFATSPAPLVIRSVFTPLRRPIPVPRGEKRSNRARAGHRYSPQNPFSQTP